MKKVVSICLVVLLAISIFASCADNAPPVTNSPEVRFTLTPSPTSEANYPEDINIDYATEEFLSKYVSYDRFVEFEKEEISLVMVALSTCTEITDFRFIKVGYSVDDNDISFFEDEILYSNDEFLPEKPFVVGISFPGTLPTRGISFTDGSNTTRYYYIAMSGENGSLFLVEF